MRARNLKPSFFKNEHLAEIPFQFRILFQGLWCLADREGRLENRPMRIKAEIFPYDSVDVRKGIGSLSELGFIRCYGGSRAGESLYLEIVNFAKHQNPHRQEPPSKIPEYSEPLPNDFGTSSEVVGPLPSSLFPLPSNGIPQTPPTGAFDLIWAQYPKKDGRKASERHFNATVKTMKDFLDIQNALECYLRKIAKDHTESRYVKNGSTWFCNWRDWINYEEEKSDASHGSASIFKQVADRRREAEAKELGAKEFIRRPIPTGVGNLSDV